MSEMDTCYPALIGLAEQYRLLNNIKECIRCLQAIFYFKPPPLIESQTHLQLGGLLQKHSRNFDLAKHHLEQAWYLGQNVSQDEIKLKSASLLARMYEKQGNPGNSKQILTRALELSGNNSYWNFRLLFQAADLHYRLKDSQTAHSFLITGLEQCQMTGARYTRCLLLLSQALLYLAEKRFNEANPRLQQASVEIENWVANSSHLDQTLAAQQKEYLQIFYLVLQVCYYLMVGQVKSVKGILKQLQGSIQTVTSPDWPPETDLGRCDPMEQFLWLPRDQLCVLVYLITVMHSMQGGYMEKAERYTEKAIQNIMKLQNEDTSLLSSIHVMLVEHIIQCRLVQGHRLQAIQDIRLLCSLLEKNPVLLQDHKAQLHTLLGLYAMSMNCLTEAENQLNAALRTSRETELWTFANLNLAIVYLRSQRVADFEGLVQRIAPDNLSSTSHCLKAAAYYIHGLQAFLSDKPAEAKRYLRETLKMANAEDLNRLISCSLALLGQIFLNMGVHRESLNMVTPAMQLASKIPDLNVQLWASAILKDLYQVQNDHAKVPEGNELYSKYNQAFFSDQQSAAQQPDHHLIHWTDGAFPPTGGSFI